jgi:hypothetical protein
MHCCKRGQATIRFLPEEASAQSRGSSQPSLARAHDVRLVAAMQSYAITRLLTFNGPPFRGLPVTILDPASL